MNEWTTAKLCDVANLVLGVFLFFSPFLFAFPEGMASWNAYLIGIVIVGLSIAALMAFAMWEEWVNLVVGLWAIVSPWVLQFQGTTAATVHMVVGLIVAVLAAIELWYMYQHPPRLPAH